MTIERCKELIDFFSGLQVMGDLTDENILAFTRNKNENFLQIIARTSLGQIENTFGDKRLFFFKDTPLKGKRHCYFTFAFTFDRGSNDIIIHGLLPSIVVEKDKITTNYHDVLRMHRNSIVYDLNLIGFQLLSLEPSGDRRGIEFVVKADENITASKIIDTYNEVKRINVNTSNNFKLFYK